MEDQFSKMFEFDQDARRVTLLPKYAEQLSQGNLCPNGSMELAFSLTSNILGSSRHSFEIKVEPEEGIELIDFAKVSLG